MSKAVMMSIQPKWVEKILNGEKTIEVRKTAPKLETPFKVYVYCTKDINNHLIRWHGDDKPSNYFDILSTKELHDEGIVWGRELNGKVVAEFTCDRVYCGMPYNFPYETDTYAIHKDVWEKTCVPYDELSHYAMDKKLYLWHISDLKIYDKPRELGEFERVHEDCPYYEDCEKIYNAPCHISRPPQSWCYVEEI